MDDNTLAKGHNINIQAEKFDSALGLSDRWKLHAIEPKHLAVVIFFISTGLFINEEHLDGLVQDRGNSIANALGLL